MNMEEKTQPLTAPGGGWRVPDVRRWAAPLVETVTAVLPGRSVYCSGSPMHAQCIGYDPQTKKPCSCSCHPKNGETG